MIKINNEILSEVFSELNEIHSEEDSVFILLNSLSVLGDKKVIVENGLSEFNINRLNKYKYPERLASFINKTSNKTLQWKHLSFAKLAFS